MIPDGRYCIGSVEGGRRPSNAGLNHSATRHRDPLRSQILVDLRQLLAPPPRQIAPTAADSVFTREFNVFELIRHETEFAEDEPRELCVGRCEEYLALAGNRDVT